MINRWCTRLLAVIAVVAGVMMSAAPEAKACTGLQATCWCAVATGGWNSGVLAKYDLGCRKPSTTRPRECSKNCSDKVSGNIGLLGGATAACAKNNWASACVRGYGYIGATGTNNADGTLGRITCTPPKAAVTKMECPAGSWWDGNVKYCVKGSGCNLPAGAPNTSLGNYGFIWQGALYLNAGPGKVIVVTPAVAGSGTHAPGC